MNLGKPIRETPVEGPEWVHDPSERCPHRWRNVKTGHFQNRQPTPPPKITRAPYQGPKADDDEIDIVVLASASLASISDEGECYMELTVDGETTRFPISPEYKYVGTW